MVDSCAPPAQVLSTYNSAWGSGHTGPQSHTDCVQPTNIGGRALFLAKKNICTEQYSYIFRTVIMLF